MILAIWLIVPVVQRWASATMSVPADRVRTATVERGDLVRDVSVQGRVVAAVSPTLTLEVEAGEQVLEGQVIATVVSPELTNALQQAESAFAQRKMELEFDEHLAFELRASEFDVSRQELSAEDIRRQVDDLAIKSPANGIVGDLLVAQKEAVSRDTPVMAVVDLTRFEVDAQIPESYADDLAVGVTAEILVDRERYTGQLAAVSPEIVSNQVASRIRFSDSMPGNLRQNQRLTVKVLLVEHNDVMMVQPGQFLDSGGGRIVYIVTEEGMAEKRQIETGARSLGAVEVVAGLQPGDTIVISNLDAFRSAETVLLTD